MGWSEVEAGLRALSCTVVGIPGFGLEAFGVSGLPKVSVFSGLTSFMVTILWEGQPTKGGLWL